MSGCDFEEDIWSEKARIRDHHNGAIVRLSHHGGNYCCGYGRPPRRALAHWVALIGPLNGDEYTVDRSPKPLTAARPINALKPTPTLPKEAILIIEVWREESQQQRVSVLRNWISLGQDTLLSLSSKCFSQKLHPKVCYRRR